MPTDEIEKQPDFDPYAKEGSKWMLQKLDVFYDLRGYWRYNRARIGWSNPITKCFRIRIDLASGGLSGNPELVTEEVYVKERRQCYDHKCLAILKNADSDPNSTKYENTLILEICAKGQYDEAGNGAVTVPVPSSVRSRFADH